MGKRILFILFAAISLVLCLRIYADNVHYTTPDSAFYLRAADNLKAGKGYIAPKEYPFNKDSSEAYLAVWPAGYPLLIAGVSRLTHTSSLFASKLVNLIFLGLLFMLLYRWVGAYAWFPALYFCSYSMLEIYSHTWSEGVFLFFMLYLVYILSDLKKERKLLVLELWLCLVALFLLRYVGLIYFFFTAIFGLFHLYRKNYRHFWHIFLSLCLSGVFVLTYFYLNYQKTGSFAAGERFEYAREPAATFFIQLIQAIINELSVARNYYFTGEKDYLYLILLFIQAVVLVKLYRERSFLKGTIFNSGNINYILFYAGFFYLVSIILLAWFIAFDSFDYRILAPFSMPLYIGLMIGLTFPENREYFKRTYQWITVFMILSLLVNLPKNFLLDYFSS